jgi:capsular polysaccharide biosynthesis protein
VLAYAPRAPRLLWRRLVTFAAMASICTAVGALVGWAIAPPAVYESTGLFQVRSVSVSSAAEVQPVFRREVQRNVDAVSSSWNVQRASQALAGNGIAISPESIAPSLRVENPANANLVSVSFTHRDPATAASVVSELLTRFPLKSVDPKAEDPAMGNGIRLINDGSVPFPISHVRSFTLAGAMAGGLLYLLVFWSAAIVREAAHVPVSRYTACTGGVSAAA